MPARQRFSRSEGRNGGVRPSPRAAFVQEKRLSQREIQTLDLLANFLENKEIADNLGVSVPVAAKILRNVFRKCAVHKRAEAIQIWKALG